MDEKLRSAIERVLSSQFCAVGQDRLTAEDVAARMRAGDIDRPDRWSIDIPKAVLSAAVKLG